MAYATKEKRNAYARKYQSQPHVRKYKQEYHKNKTEEQKAAKVQYDLEYHAKHREKYLQRCREYRAEWQRKALERLGDRCSSPECSWINPDGTRGCVDRRCIQIDHIAGNGSKEVKAHAGYYRKVFEDTTGAYQLLCANCNWIKRFVNKEHGHRSKA